MRKFTLIAAAMGASLALAAPTFAQDAVAGANLPTCSATVTDHCVQREHHAMAASHRMARHHMTRHHHHTGKHHAK